MSTKPHDADARPAGHGGSQPWAPAFAPGGAAHGSQSAGGAAATGFVPGSVGNPPAVAPLALAERARLDAAFRATLERGIHGLCFSPYLEGQQPGSQISAAQIRERMAIIRPHTRWVRSFSCTDGHEQTPRIAHELGLKTLVGAWLGTDREINEREIAGAIAVARAGHADIVAVGNEVLLREDLAEDELIGHIQRVKAGPARRAGGLRRRLLPVREAPARHRRVRRGDDQLLPVLGGLPARAGPALHAEHAGAHARGRAGQAHPHQRDRLARPGQRLPRRVPGAEAAMQYFVDTAAWAEREGIEVFYFAAFDEAWKVGAEGDVGAYWGLWDKDARPKFG